MPSSRKFIVERWVDGQFVEVFSTDAPSDHEVSVAAEGDHVHVRIEPAAEPVAPEPKAAPKAAPKRRTKKA